MTPAKFKPGDRIVAKYDTYIVIASKHELLINSYGNPEECWLYSIRREDSDQQLYWFEETLENIAFGIEANNGE